mmetsp:Transcript_22712/g.33631  ORF Transcript_22712/g.33631 Transcript_22712/m.33631 type:complete len:153 (+) Transcript_22712:155-613(+)
MEDQGNPHYQTTLQSSGWYILFFAISLYYLRENVINPYIDQRKKKKNYEEATAPERVSRLREQMLKVREEQQIQALKKSQEAKEKRQLIKSIRLKETAVNQTSTTGRKFGSKSGDDNKGKPTSRSSYNPLMPSSGSAGPSYRPSRRSAGGGG